MTEQSIKSLADSGVYPIIDIYSDTFSYFVVENIPFLSQSFNDSCNYKEMKNRERWKTAFLSSMIIADNPVGDFSHTIPHFYLDELGDTIRISLKDSKLKDADLKNRIKDIIKGKTSIINADYEFVRNAEKRNANDYIIYPQVSNFKLEEFAKKFKCESIRVSPKRIRTIFDFLLKQSRLIHVSLYYLLRANSLIHKYFPEEAAVNLQMTVEAIVEDYMAYKQIKKKKALEKLYEKIKMKGIEALAEHGLDRNEFLAHADKDMFTDAENINDPDRYCYETYYYFVNFIMKYINFKRKGLI